MVLVSGDRQNWQWAQAWGVDGGGDLARHGWWVVQHDGSTTSGSGTVVSAGRAPTGHGDSASRLCGAVEIRRLSGSVCPIYQSPASSAASVGLYVLWSASAADPNDSLVSIIYPFNNIEINELVNLNIIVI